jgi:hypothetical protein
MYKTIPLYSAYRTSFIHPKLNMVEQKPDTSIIINLIIVGIPVLIFGFERSDPVMICLQ